MSDEGYQVGFKFQMSYGQSLEIRSNRDVDEMEIEPDEVVEGIHYFLFWKRKTMGVFFSTRLQAMAAALGAQWANKIG